MEVWSDGAETVVFDDSGITYLRGGETEGVFSIVGEPVALGAKKGFRSSHHRILAVDGAQRIMIAGECGEIPYAVHLDRKDSPERLSFKWYEAAHIRGDEYFAVLPEDERLLYSLVRLNSGAQISDEREVEMPECKRAELGQVTWQRLAEKLGAAGNGDAPVSPKGPFAIQVNAYGTVVCDQGCGTVVLIPAGQEKATLGLRFPMSGDESLLACATPSGVAVASAIQERHSCLAVFDAWGVKVAEISKIERELIWGGGMPFCLDGTTVCWTYGSKDGILGEFALPKLELRSQSILPGGTVIYDRVHSVGGGKMLLASRSAITQAERSGAGSGGPWAGAPVERHLAGRSAKRALSPVTGPAALQLRALSPEWRGAASGPFALEFEVVNSGGEGAGLIVELSGDAVANGSVKAKRVVAAGLSGTFVLRADGTMAAEVGEVAVKSASEKATKKAKIEPWVLKPLVIELDGCGAGAGGFLMVRVKTSGNAAAACGKALLLR